LSPYALRADERIRTADPFITSEVLYQLSYVGAAAKSSGGTRRRVRSSGLRRGGCAIALNRLAAARIPRSIDHGASQRSWSL
jgi:hypothetical protein